MAPRGRADAGFTLVEVLVGITLLAMLGTLIAGGMRLGGRAWTGAEQRTANSDAMMQVQALFRRTLSRARPAFASADPRDMAIAFAGAPETLSLMAPQPGTQYGGPWVAERFYLARDGASRALFVDLARPGAAAERVRLLDHVARLGFAYFGAPGTGEPAAWRDDWTAGSRLPQLVRVAIARDDPKLGAWPDLIVATRITANAGCVFDALAATCRRGR